MISKANGAALSTFVSGIRQMAVGYATWGEGFPEAVPDFVEILASKGAISVAPWQFQRISGPFRRRGIHRALASVCDDRLLVLLAPGDLKKTEQEFAAGYPGEMDGQSHLR